MGGFQLHLLGQNLRMKDVSGCIQIEASGWHYFIPILTLGPRSYARSCVIYML